MRTRLHVLAAVAALAITVVGLTIAEETKPQVPVGASTTFTNADLEADKPAAAEPKPKAAPAKEAGEKPPVAVPKKQLYAKNFYNKPAPKFAVEKFLGEQPDLKGKVIVVDFWATWCPPCRASIPEMNELYHKFKDRGVVVVGLTNEDEGAVKRMKKPVIEYPVAIDTKSRMAEQLGIQSIPNVVVIDPDGIVRWQGIPSTPGHELTPAVIENILKTYGKDA